MTSLILILLILNQLVEINGASNKSINSNYFETICQFLKFPDICRSGYDSNLLKMSFSFGLALDEECGFKNETIKDVYFYKNDDQTIFIYSIIETHLKEYERTDNNTIIYSVSIPLSELISQFNNKNIPSIFIYLPVFSNLTSDLFSLDIKLDSDFEFQDFKINQTITKKLENNKAIQAKNCVHLNQSTNFFSQIIPSVTRPQSKNIKLKDHAFYTYLQMPKMMKKQLQDNSFIADLIKIEKNVFLKLKFEFEGISENLANQLVATSGLSIVLNYCAKIRNNSFITYGCEVIANYENLYCHCIEFPITYYFSYFRFVLIVTMLIFLVYLTRIFSDLVKHTRKLLLFEKTKQDRVLYILCSNRTALFDYILTFEIGCASPTFDFENTCIDFELQTPDARTMTQGRILGKILSKETINCVDFKIKRLTQLNRDMLDSIIIQHNCTNPRAKIFLYDINLKQISEQKKFIFSINDYIRSYKQKYILIENTFANQSSIRSGFHYKTNNVNRIRDIDSFSEFSNSPQIKSCEIFPHKRIYVQAYPNLNDFEINLILIFSSFFSFQITIWLIQHKHCIKRTFGCYFNIFKISFILTSSTYLVIFLLYRFLFKHQQMKSIYLKKLSIWSFGAQFVNLTLILATVYVIRQIFISKITLYIFEFYACTLTLMFIIPLLMLCVDLTNIIIENFTLKHSLSFNSIQFKLKSKSSDKKRSKFSRKTPAHLRSDQLAFKSAEFKPSIDYTTDSLASENYLHKTDLHKANLHKADLNEIDDYYSEMIALKRNRRIDSQSSLMPLKSFPLKDSTFK